MSNEPKLPSKVETFIGAFNRLDFFFAHEVLEDVWRTTRRGCRLRRNLQGLIQLAVAFHHQSTGNRVGALSVLRRALRNIKGAERSFPQFDFDRLRVRLALWEKYLDRPVPAGQLNSDGHPAPPLPKITRARNGPD
jgi:predicted metal-dependent hydrolase